MYYLTAFTISADLPTMDRVNSAVLTGLKTQLREYSKA